jgi:PAS domain S-box-containing protein
VLVDRSDVWARRQAERDLRDSVARFREIAEHLADALVIAERGERGVAYANPAFELLYGRPARALHDCGLLWRELVHADDRQRVEQAYARFFEGAPLDEQYRIVRPDGEVRWVRARIFPVHDDDGNVHRDVKLIQDVTSARALEEELRQSQKMEAVGALASGVAHDFNNVLQAVLGCINVARREDTPPERARMYLDHAAAAARRGGHLASQLMAFTRKQDAAPITIEVDALVEAIANMLARLVTEEVELVLAVGARGCKVLADPSQLERILMNLAANARDAMQGGGTLTIRTDAVQADVSMAERHRVAAGAEYVRVFVSDTGTGMDEQTRSRIFEPFFTTKAVGKGTGLGLSTVFAVTRQLGGHVDVESEPGRGTTFIVYLPRAASDAPREPTAPYPIVRFTGTVMLVEDEPLVRLTVRQYLEELGLQVLLAAGPEDALARSAASPVDLLVTDVVLPTMRGTRLAARLRQRQPDLAVLYVSATPEHLDDEPIGERALVLPKPFGLEELARALSRLLGATEPARRVESGTHTILLVEDEATSREAVADVLESESYTVLAAGHAEEALELVAARAQPVDLLLTDVTLPGVDGGTLVKLLRQTQPELRVVFMSGLMEAPSGATAFVQKPIDLDVLLAVVARALA